MLYAVKAANRRWTSGSAAVETSIASVSSANPPRISLRSLLTPNLAPLLGVFLAACALEGSLLRWWLPTFSLVGHPGFYGGDGNPLVWILGDGPQATRRFFALVGSITLPYLIALGLAGRLRGRTALAIAIAGSAVSGMTMLFLFPAGATDLFRNILDGRGLWLHGHNPMVTAASALTGDPFARYVTAWQQEASTYGPLWYLLTGPAVLLGGVGRNSNIVAFKALPFLFELVSLGAIAGIVHRVDPKRVVSAVICFGWNPLVLWEVAGNGHNDVIMMAFVLLSVLVLLSRRWPLAFPLLACSVLVKYVSLILLPLFAVWIVKRHGRRAFAPLCAGLIGAAAVTSALLAPFWAGTATFTVLLRQPSRFIFSPGLALLRLGGVQLPPYVMGILLPHSVVALEVRATLAFAFVLLLSVALFRLRPSAVSLLDGCITAFFLFLVLAVSWFWPWYLVWGLALAALRPGTALNRLLVMLSLTAFLAYEVMISGAGAGLFNHIPLQLTEPLLIFLAPLIYAARYVWPPETVLRGWRQMADRRRNRTESAAPL